MAENISDSIPIYSEYLTNVNLCINLFKELESNRTWGDWFVGDRGKINFTRLLEVTSEFKEKLEKILPIYITLCSNIEQRKRMELRYQRESNLQLEYFKDEPIAKQVKQPSTPTSTPKVDNSLCKEQTSILKTMAYGVGGAVGGGAVASGIVYTGTVAALAMTGPVSLIPACVALAIGAIAAL